MLALRLVRLIESHSAELAQGLMDKILSSERTTDYRHLDRAELQRAVRDIFQHLSDWLLTKTESDIELRYTQLGSRRAQEGVSHSQWVWAIVLTKDHLWGFLQREALVDGVVELFGELEFLRLLDQFFDRAMYYETVGFERALLHQRLPDRRKAA
jgi:RsbT co-antagonist protein rsbRD N-terminal domain